MMINVGYGGQVQTLKVAAISHYQGNPVIALVRGLRDKGQVLDITAGRKTRSVIWLDNGNIILSAISPEALAQRINDGKARRQGLKDWGFSDCSVAEGVEKELEASQGVE